MCGLCGFLSYDTNPLKDINTLTNELMKSASVRGTDAAGIAFNRNGNVLISKEGKSAEKIEFKLPESVKVLIGHTRHSTQGSEKKNYNNHPFYGRVKSNVFAFAHNGVLTNDVELRRKYKLPATKIETDSYAPVQLLEKLGKLDANTIKKMAEAVEGSFSFSILDKTGNLYLVKGDSPLTLVHFPKEKLYVYASTDEILWKALIETELFRQLKSGSFEVINIDEGEIVNISPKGKIKKTNFEFTYRFSLLTDWRYCGGWYTGDYEDTYIADLKTVASHMGISPDEVDHLLQEGFTPDEVEEFIYGYESMEV